MRTVSGHLVMTKTEHKNIELLLEHVERDISYGGGGTFTDGTNEDNANVKEIQKVKEAIEDIRWILKSSTTK